MGGAEERETDSDVCRPVWYLGVVFHDGATGAECVGFVEGGTEIGWAACDARDGMCSFSFFDDIALFDI